MQTQARIPVLSDLSFEGAQQWFAAMQCANLLFHPEDDPFDIFCIHNSQRTFSDNEAEHIRQLLENMDNALGHDQVIAAAYPVFMKACGNRLDA